MTEPLYLQGDSIARSNFHFIIRDLECGNCLVEQEVEVQEEYSHDTTTWYAEWRCANCNTDREQEGWYSNDDL
jgi:hypothetical protein